MQPVERREKITLMMRPSLKAALQELAAEKGVGYQTLAQQFLDEKVKEVKGKRP